MIYRAFLLSLLFLTQAIAQTGPVPVTLTLPTLTAKPGETIDVEVIASDLNGLDIVASDITITYDARIVTAGRLAISGTLTNRWSEAHRVGFVEGSQDTMGLIDIAVATANRIPTTGGVFLKIPFTVSDSATIGQVTPLTFTELVLNNGTPAVIGVNGSITIADQPNLVGDFNGDCVVDFQDFILFAGNFGTQAGDENFNAIYDLNSDGNVGFADFIIFIGQFGKTCDDVTTG